MTDILKKNLQRKMMKRDTMVKSISRHLEAVKRTKWKMKKYLNEIKGSSDTSRRQGL